MRNIRAPERETKKISREEGGQPGTLLAKAKRKENFRKENVFSKATATYK